MGYFDNHFSLLYNTKVLTRSFWIWSKQSLFNFLYMLSLWNRIAEKRKVFIVCPQKDLFFSFLCHSSTNGKISATKATLTLTLLYSAFQLPMGKSLKGYSTFSLLSIWYNFTYHIVVVVVDGIHSLLLLLEGTIIVL